jgi:hypothetical protein
VRGVEGGEVRGGGEVAVELGGGAVDGRCELGEVEYIQGAGDYQSSFWLYWGS